MPAKYDSPDITKIVEILPHRYPFLLVDKVIDWDGRTLKAIKNVTYNEPFFPGHFPQKPVMPGVLILESLGQACGLLMLMMPNPELDKLRNSLFFMVGIDKARFRSVVVPGDQLELHVSMKRDKRLYFSFETRAEVNGKVVTEAIINLMISKEEEEQTQNS